MPVPIEQASEVSAGCGRAVGREHAQESIAEGGAAVESPFIVLIAPNISVEMGGEAIKSLQIYQELVRRGLRVHQVTHARVRDEIDRRYPGMQVSYVEDNWLQKLCWRSIVFRPLVNGLFFWYAARLAQQIVDSNPGAVVHYTAPISPVIPHFRIRGAPVVVGPLNGNIHHPKAFRARESLGERLRRLLAGPVQVFHRLFFSGKQSADVLLVAGGERTYRSLRTAGCRDAQFRESLDSGIPAELRDQPLVEHRDVNLRFVHVGRLVAYKGTDLAIRSLTCTKRRIELDVIGRGPEKERLESLVRELGLQDRVRFIDWFTDHDKLSAVLRLYRGFVFPSLAEANGIVVQEAMMLGLPVICLDWGGPALLVNRHCGILLPPTDQDRVIGGLAQAMDQLASDPDLANQMAGAGRATAVERGFAWDDLIGRWQEMYRELSRQRSSAST